MYASEGKFVHFENFYIKKQTKLIVCILNSDWLVVNTRVVFIGYGQEYDYSSQRVRLMLKSHSCKPMKLQYLPLITEDI